MRGSLVLQLRALRGLRETVDVASHVRLPESDAASPAAHAAHAVDEARDHEHGTTITIDAVAASVIAP